MSLKVMCAGCSAEERERAESDVRRALGARAGGNETWIISVINLQSRWSVTLDGPGIRALNFTAQPGRLAEAILEALQSRDGATAVTPPPVASPPVPSPVARTAPTGVAKPAAVAPKPAAVVPPPAAKAAAPSRAAVPPRAAPPAPPPGAGRAGPRRHAHECEGCHQRFSVSFEGVAGEPDRMTPVACPHCWHMNHMFVGETAADTSDYRAEKD